ncbi:hypothetical protein PLESTB_001077700 [Pleodorina starrii]|uniref:Uncharacterized protein n=1 Tax=Pleodorina starrii TaxID=330485 RepID=A0A9W6BPS1_9CHLO|nr:hypothetical protein PLESTM_001181400 [Pleodorina starrii]GLC56186.1 hypothetical protein PLESTB_001077700 [Pleodorina starrii]GLC74928.1 hypothetical protein PLESTF_001574000 [Pleodorina starrii]
MSLDGAATTWPWGAADASLAVVTITLLLGLIIILLQALPWAARNRGRVSNLPRADEAPSDPRVDLPELAPPPASASKICDYETKRLSSHELQLDPPSSWEAETPAAKEDDGSGSGADDDVTSPFDSAAATSTAVFGGNTKRGCGINDASAIASAYAAAEERLAAAGGRDDDAGGASGEGTSRQHGPSCIAGASTYTSVVWGCTNALEGLSAATQGDASLASELHTGDTSSRLIQSFPTEEWPLSPTSVTGHAAAAIRSGSGRATRGGSGDAAAAQPPITAGLASTGYEGSGGRTAPWARWKPPGLSYVPAAAAPPPRLPSLAHPETSGWASDGASVESNARSADVGSAAPAAKLAAGHTGLEISTSASPRRNLPPPLDTPLFWYRGGAASGRGIGVEGGGGELPWAVEMGGGSGGGDGGGVRALTAVLTEAAARAPPPMYPLTPAQSTQPLPAASMLSYGGTAFHDDSTPTPRLSSNPSTQQPQSSNPSTSATAPPARQHPSFLSYYSHVGLSGEPTEGPESSAAPRGQPVATAAGFLALASPGRRLAESYGASPSLSASGSPARAVPAALQAGAGAATATVPSSGPSAAWDAGSPRSEALAVLHGPPEALSEPSRRRGGGGGGLLIGGVFSGAGSEVSAHATETSLPLSDGSRADGGHLLAGAAARSEARSEARSAATGMRSGACSAAASHGSLLSAATVAEEREYEAAAAVGSGSTLSDSTNGGGGSAVLQLNASPFFTRPTPTSRAVEDSAWQQRAASAAAAEARARQYYHAAAAAAAPVQESRDATRVPHQPSINLGELLAPPAGAGDPAAAGSGAAYAAAPAGPHGGRSPASVLYTSRCSSRLLSVKLESAAAVAAVSGAGPAANVPAAAGAISREVASTLLRHVPPGRLVRISALAVRGCVQLLVRVQMGPPADAAAAHGVDMMAALMAALGRMAAAAAAPPEGLPAGAEASGVEAGDDGDDGGVLLGEAAPAGFAMNLALQGGFEPPIWRAFTTFPGPLAPASSGLPLLPPGLPAAAAAEPGAIAAAAAPTPAPTLGSADRAAGGHAPAGPTEAASPGAGGVAVGADAAPASPQGWQELTVGGVLPAAEGAISAVIPVPAVLAAAGTDYGGGGAKLDVRLELLYDEPAVGSAVEGGNAAGGLVAAPRRVVAAAEGQVLLDEEYDIRGMSYIDIPLPADSLSRLPPGSLAVWMLSADPRVVGGAPSLLAGAAELLLLPPPAAEELQAYVRAVLERAATKPAAQAAQAQGASIEPDSSEHTAALPKTAAGAESAAVVDATAAAAVPLTRGQLWTRHLQPLLVDFGYVVAAARELHKASDETAATAWLELAADVLAHCEAAGLAACGELLRQAIDGGSVTEVSIASAVSAGGGVGGGGRAPAGDAAAAATPPAATAMRRAPTPSWRTQSEVGVGTDTSASAAKALAETAAAVEAGPQLQMPSLRAPPEGQFGAGDLPYNGATALVDDGGDEAGGSQADNGEREGEDDEGEGNPYGSPFSTNNVIDGGPSRQPEGYSQRTLTVLMRPLPPKPWRHHAGGGNGSSALLPPARVFRSTQAALAVCTAAGAADSAAHHPLQRPSCMQPPTSAGAAGSTMYSTLPIRAASAAAVSHCGSGSGRYPERAGSDPSTSLGLDVPPSTYEAGCCLDPQQSGVHTGNTITDPLCATAAQMLSGIASTAADSDGRRSYDGRIGVGGDGGGAARAPEAAALARSGSAAASMLPPATGSFAWSPLTSPTRQPKGAAVVAAAAAEGPTSSRAAGGHSQGSGHGPADGSPGHVRICAPRRRHRDGVGSPSGSGGPADLSAAAAVPLPAGYEEVEVEVLLARGPEQSAAGGHGSVGLEVGARASSPRRRGGGSGAGRAASALQTQGLTPGPLADLQKTSIHPPPQQRGAAATTAAMVADDGEATAQGANGGNGGRGSGAAGRVAAQPRAAAPPRGSHGRGGGNGGCSGRDDSSGEDRTDLDKLLDLGWREVECGLLLRKMSPLSAAIGGGSEDGGSGGAAGASSLCFMSACEHEGAADGPATAADGAAAAQLSAAPPATATAAPSGEHGRGGGVPRAAAATGTGGGPASPNAGPTWQSKVPPQLESSQPPPAAAAASPAERAPAGGSRWVDKLVAAATALGFHDVTCTLLVKTNHTESRYLEESPGSSSLDAGWLDMSITTSERQGSSAGGGDGPAARSRGDDSRRCRLSAAYQEVRCGMLLKVLSRRPTAPGNLGLASR